MQVAELGICFIQIVVEPARVRDFVPIGDAQRFHPLLQHLAGGDRFLGAPDGVHCPHVQGEERGEKHGCEGGGDSRFHEGERVFAARMSAQLHCPLESRKSAAVIISIIYVGGGFTRLGLGSSLAGNDQDQMSKSPSRPGLSGRLRDPARAPARELESLMEPAITGHSIGLYVPREIPKLYPSLSRLHGGVRALRNRMPARAGGQDDGTLHRAGSRVRHLLCYGGAIDGQRLGICRPCMRFMRPDLPGLRR